MRIDMWYGDDKSKIAFVDVFFSDIDCIYRGNVYDDNKRIIGDYSSDDSTEIEQAFPGIFR